jgi:hypothetical protein
MHTSTRSLSELIQTPVFTIITLEAPTLVATTA